MASKEQILANTVQRFPALDDKSNPFFMDKNKKGLAWKEVAAETGY